MTGFSWLSFKNLISLDTANFCSQGDNDLHPEQADSQFRRLDYLHLYSMRSVINNKLFIPRGKTNNFQKAMAIAGSRIWNEIPKEIGIA